MGTPPTPPVTPTANQPAGELTERIERQMIGARDVRFRTSDVQPPAALYVTADDGLYVALSVQGVAVSMNVTATILLADGRVQANTWGVNNSVIGSTQTFLFPLSEGFLINVSVQPQSGVRYGQTWIFICVRRGGLAAGVNLQTLISDTVDSFGGPTWPFAGISHPVTAGGYLTSATYGPVPAGTVFTWGAPAWARMQLRSMYAVLVTGAAVATRQVYLDIRDTSNNVYYRDFVEATQAASTQVDYSWGLMLGTSQTATVANAVARSFPSMPLLPNMNMIIGCANIQPADQFTYVGIISEVAFSL